MRGGEGRGWLRAALASNPDAKACARTKCECMRALCAAHAFASARAHGLIRALRRCAGSARRARGGGRQDCKTAFETSPPSAPAGASAKAGRLALRRTVTGWRVGPGRRSVLAAEPAAVPQSPARWNDLMARLRRVTVEGGKAVLKVSGARARVAGGVRARVPESARMG